MYELDRVIALRCGTFVCFAYAKDKFNLHMMPTADFIRSIAFSSKDYFRDCVGNLVLALQSLSFEQHKRDFVAVMYGALTGGDYYKELFIDCICEHLVEHPLAALQAVSIFLHRGNMNVEDYIGLPWQHCSSFRGGIEFDFFHNPTPGRIALKMVPYAVRSVEASGSLYKFFSENAATVPQHRLKLQVPYDQMKTMIISGLPCVVNVTTRVEKYNNKYSATMCFADMKSFGFFDRCLTHSLGKTFVLNFVKQNDRLEVLHEFLLQWLEWFHTCVTKEVALKVWLDSELGFWLLHGTAITGATPAFLLRGVTDCSAFLVPRVLPLGAGTDTCIDLISNPAYSRVLTDTSVLIERMDLVDRPDSTGLFPVLRAVAEWLRNGRPAKDWVLPHYKWAWIMVVRTALYFSQYAQNLTTVAPLLQDVNAWSILKWCHSSDLDTFIRPSIYGWYSERFFMWQAFPTKVHLSIESALGNNLTEKWLNSSELFTMQQRKADYYFRNCQKSIGKKHRRIICQVVSDWSSCTYLTPDSPPAPE